jgi:outer membrane cobalamin receptor
LLLLVFLWGPSWVDAATLRGVVVDPDGREVAGIRVLVSGRRPGVTETFTDANGRFEVVDLAPGRHEVRVVASGFTADPEAIDLGDAGAAAELTITLRISAISESLVVSAAQVDLPLSQAASSIQVISGDEISSRQLHTVGDALRMVPGLSIARNGTLGSLTSLFTRGGESDFTLILVDGMRANAFGGGIDLAQVPLIDVERVEVVRGPQSAVFGSDALAGVVQIVTRKGDRTRLDASVEGGSLGSIRGSLAAAVTMRGGMYTSGQAEHAQSDGYTGIAPATGERVSNDDGRIRHAGGSLGWRSTTGAEIRAQGLVSFTERGFPGAFGSNPIGAYERVDRVSRGESQRRQLHGTWTQPWSASGRIRQRSEIGVTNFDSDFVSSFGASESETRRVTVRTQADTALTTSLGVSAGLELLRERAGSTFITGAQSQLIPVERLVTGYFAELRYLASSRMSMAGGLRMDRVRRDAMAGNPTAFTPRPAFPEDTVTAVSPRFSASYLLQGGNGGGGATRLHGSAGAGLRPPDAFEIAFTDNPDLKSERSRSADIGLQQTFGSGAVVLDATGFFNAYDDLIVAVGPSFRDASRYQTDNVSNARSRGLELSSGIKPTSSLEIRASYTLLDTEILSVDRADGQAPAPYRVGESLIRRPRHKGGLTALYSTSLWTVFGEASFRGSVRDIEPTFGAFGGVFDAKGYAVLNLGGAVRLSRFIELLARVENVVNRRYEEAFGFPAPGRSGIVGVKIAAGR